MDVTIPGKINAARMGTTALVVIGGSLTTAQGTKPRHFLDVATAHPTERTGSGRGAGMGILGAPG